MADRRVHLVLGAGGMRSISYVGAVAALEQAAVAVASLSCASAGTLFGALYAGGLSTRRLDELVRRIDMGRYRGDRYWIPRLFGWPFAAFAVGLAA